MAEYIYKASQTIERPCDEVFEFFSKAENLERHYAASVGISDRYADTDRDRERDAYRLSHLDARHSDEMALEITVWDPPNEFADEQRGPYKQWIHTHRFTEIESNKTLMEDEVRYRLPLEPLGDLVQFFVEWELQSIFGYRRKIVDELLMSTSGLKS